MSDRKKEVRMAEVRAINADGEENSRLIEGRAIVFDQETVIWTSGDIEYKEKVDRGALIGADMSDVPYKYNHSNNVMIMARTRNKTLELTQDNKGLLIRASLANTTAGNDLYELVKRGDIDKQSFAFTVKEDSYDVKTHTRTILKIDKLYDVSAVDLPAYEQTSLSARSYFEERNKEEILAKENDALTLEKRKLKLRTMIN